MLLILLLLWMSILLMYWVYTTAKPITIPFRTMLVRSGLITVGLGCAVFCIMFVAARVFMWAVAPELIEAVEYLLHRMLESRSRAIML